MLLSRPPKSRNQLEFSYFKKVNDSQWELSLTQYYMDLFKQKCHDITRMNLKSTENTIFGPKLVLYKLSEEQVQIIDNFICCYEEYVIIDINKNIRNNFTDELNSCMALNYTYERNNRRTSTGELTYHAKYRRDKNSINELTKRLAKAMKMMPFTTKVKSSCISYIPFIKNRHFYLPKELALGIKNFYDDRLPLIDSELLIDKPELKNTEKEKKITIWEKIIAKKKIKLTDSIAGKTIWIIDDYYQSGATLWSYAKYLKSSGAHAVLGLVCAKNWSDSDNVNR